LALTSSSFQHDSYGTDSAISLSEVISALSYALDLTEGAVHGHALRSCLLGMRIAEEMRLPSELTTSLYYALLLKDIGCSSNAGRMYQDVGAAERVARIFRFGGARSGVSRSGVSRFGAARFGSQHKSDVEMIGLRCDRGASIVSKLGMGPLAAQAVKCLDEHWDGSGYPERLKAEQIPLLARICAVAQYLDMFAVGRDMQGAMDTLQQRSGTWFDPEVVRVAGSLHGRGALWAGCDDCQDEIRRAVLDLDPGRRHRLEASEIDLICEAFSDVVDTKSNFTFRHSMGVADAAFGIAQRVGLKAERAQLTRRAALLHDIGKLSVSNSILDKKSQLSEAEWEAIKLHPGLTRSILERIGPFREIAVIAGEHHEKLDGSGYPNRLMAPELSIEARIVAVADVYSALLEDRPYRPGLEVDQIVSIMKKLVPYKLDQDCFDALVALVSSERQVGFGSVHAGAPSLAYGLNSMSRTV
jgi:putative nucleotidyltransferase with HDIG domain